MTSSVAGSIAAYLSSLPYEYDFTVLTFVVFLIYIYGLGLPLIMWGAMKYFGCQPTIMEMISLYGYGLTVWIPVSVGHTSTLLYIVLHCRFFQSYLLRLCAGHWSLLDSRCLDGFYSRIYILCSHKLMQRRQDYSSLSYLQCMLVLHLLSRLASFHMVFSTIARLLILLPQTHRQARRFRAAKRQFSRCMIRARYKVACIYKNGRIPSLCSSLCSCVFCRLLHFVPTCRCVRADLLTKPFIVCITYCIRGTSDLFIPARFDVFSQR